MQDCLEPMPCGFVCEDNGAHCGTIKITAASEDLRTECLADFVKRGLAGIHNFPGDDVGVNDRHAEFSEHPGDGRLAARNASGQADSQWLVS